MATIFTKIIDGTIPSIRIYEDELCIVILDIEPVAKGHALVIPKQCWSSVVECPEEVFAHIMKIVQKVDKRLREVLAADATNIVINDGPAAGQEVPHLHVHVIPRYVKDGLKLQMPKTSYGQGEIEVIGESLNLSR